MGRHRLRHPALRLPPHLPDGDLQGPRESETGGIPQHRPHWPPPGHLLLCLNMRSAPPPRRHLPPPLGPPMQDGKPLLRGATPSVSRHRVELPRPSADGCRRHPVPPGSTFSPRDGGTASGTVVTARGASAGPQRRMPQRSPTWPARRGRGFTHVRMGFVLDEDPNAARRVVAVPDRAASVNRMRVVGVAAAGIPDKEVDVRHLLHVTRLAATHFNKTKPFCQQERIVLGHAIAYLELHEPRLAVCVRSWGACALLSRVSNKRSEHRARMEAKREAAAAAATNTAQSSASQQVGPWTLSPPPPPPPLQQRPADPPAGPGGAHATGPLSAADFFACHP